MWKKLTFNPITFNRPTDDYGNGYAEQTFDQGGIKKGWSILDVY